MIWDSLLSLLLKYDNILSPLLFCSSLIGLAMVILGRDKLIGLKKNSLFLLFLLICTFYTLIGVYGIQYKSEKICESFGLEKHVCELNILQKDNFGFENTEDYPEHILLGIKKERNFRNTYDLTKGNFIGFKKDPEILYLAIKSNPTVYAYGLDLEELDQLIEKDRKKIDFKIKQFLSETPPEINLKEAETPLKEELLPSSLNFIDNLFFKILSHKGKILIANGILVLLFFSPYAKFIPNSFVGLSILLQIFIVVFPSIYMNRRISKVFCQELNYEQSECLMKRVIPLKEGGEDTAVALVFSREALTPDVFLLEKNEYGFKKMEKMEKLMVYMSNEREDSPINLFISKKKQIWELSQKWYNRSEQLEKDRQSPILSNTPEVSKK